MAWFVLSIPIGFGIAFIVNGLIIIPFLSPSTSIACGFILILGSLWIGVREQRHMNLSKKIEKLFNRLSGADLERWASGFATHYEHLGRITLYGAPLSFPPGIKYIVHYQFNTKTRSGKKQKKEFSQMLAADNIFQDQIDLDDVYKGDAPPEYKDEWFGTVLEPGDVDKKYCKILYSK